jgi:DNA repair exonuclease SbcCD nuclease subunit
VVTEVRGERVAVVGFPYQRHGVREAFPGTLEATGWARAEAGLRVLCLHHCVEGATVGPADHTFRASPDVIRCSDLPRAFAAVLSGHIHRHQLLTRDLRGRPLAAPLVYPGSIERTSGAERHETKGYALLDFTSGPGSNSGSKSGSGCGTGGQLTGHAFIPLPATAWPKSNPPRRFPSRDFHGSPGKIRSA